MISREQFLQEYTDIVNKYHPAAGHLLHYCLLKVISYHNKNLNKNLYYLGIYYPDELGDRLLNHRDILKDIAENMGLVEVAFFNATRLVKDPLSPIKAQDFRFWLELIWIASHVD
ncbi:MAG: hypothetical protein ACLFV6_12505 [Spirulinaceae cyanobacterium]